MFKIVRKKELNDAVTLLEIEAPFIAKKAQAGQFIIFRVDDYSERVPLTIADYDREKGTVTIIFQKVGLSTKLLGAKEKGDTIRDFVGPLAVATNYYLTTDDGSYGEKGFVTDKIKQLIEAGNKYDAVIAIGPIPMMKFVCLATKPYQIKTIVSLNPIMIDGTGMCGGCRVTVGGKIKFACVDGPDFDGHQVDFDELMNRNSIYKEREAEEANTHLCRLTGTKREA